MIAKCEDCFETEDFFDEDTAKLHGWRRRGNTWICPGCWNESGANDSSDIDNSEDNDSSIGGNFGFDFGGGSFGGGGAKF